MKYVIAICLFLSLVSAQAQVASASDMFNLLSKKDTTTINKQLEKMGYKGFTMSWDSIPGTQFWGYYGAVGITCGSAKTDEFVMGDALNYGIKTGKGCDFVEFTSFCFDHYKSLVTSFKLSGFSIGDALVPIVPKGKGSVDHNVPNEFEYTSASKGFRLSIFVRHEPMGLFYHVLLEPEGK
jgi:hypothetical protein